MESRDFVVVPAKGHFTVGYFLILPRQHEPSFASITSPDLTDQWWKLYVALAQRVKNILGPMMFFEHGSIFGGGYAGNTIEHAHLHVVPAKTDLVLSVVDDGRPTRRIPSLEFLSQFCRPYHLICRNEGGFYVADVSEEMESQYLRRLLYRQLYPDRNDDGWDWRRHCHEDRLRSTLELVKT